MLEIIRGYQYLEIKVFKKNLRKEVIDLYLL